MATPQATAGMPAMTNGSEWLTQMRQAVDRLDELLRLLYPESQSLDIITYHDILRVYRLTGLGAPATAAIDKSQRIVRERGITGSVGWGSFRSA